MGKTITFIGAGNMARSLITGLLQESSTQGGISHTIRVSDPSESQLTGITENWATINSYVNNADAIEGADVVVVEDLISTGGSTIQAVEVLRAAGANVVGAVAIFTYGFPQSVDNFAKIDCPFYTLSNYEAMLPIAKEMGYISDEQLPILQSWRSAPSEWMQEA